MPSTLIFQENFVGKSVLKKRGGEGDPAWRQQSFKEWGTVFIYLFRLRRKTFQNKRGGGSRWGEGNLHPQAGGRGKVEKKGEGEEEFECSKSQKAKKEICRGKHLLWLKGGTKELNTDPIEEEKNNQITNKRGQRGGENRKTYGIMVWGRPL